MNEIMMTSTAVAAADVTPSMFTDFVAWIDRPGKTERTYLTNLKAFAAWMAYEGITAPTRPDIISFREWLMSEHDAITYAPELPERWKYRTDKAGRRIRVTCTANTAKQYLQTVRAFFSWTAAAGVYPNVASNVHLPKVATNTHSKEALTVPEVQAIERGIETSAAEKSRRAAGAARDREGKLQRADEQGKRTKAIYLLSVNAGLRTVEISRANVKDFTTRGGQAWLYIQGKGHTGADEKKALAPEVAAAISDYLESRADHPTGNDPLFVATGNRSGGARLATTTISTMIKRAMQDAGISDPRITAHSLRHTAGTSVMKLNGGNVYSTQAYMRHKSPTTTEIYLHQDTEADDADTAERLYSYYHNEEPDGESLAALVKTLTPEEEPKVIAFIKALREVRK